MDSSTKRDSWTERCRGALTPEEEVELVGKILGEPDLATLEQIARAMNCPPLLRCAAIDQCVRIKLGEAKRVEARHLLDEFAHEKEPEEVVRAMAYQWLASLEVRTRGGPVTSGGEVQSAGAVRTRGGPRGPDESWRARASSDPSQHIRWLASLAD